ncbi:MAG: prolyl oligopeptidase family serine peptidase [Thomasclavelia sp.]|nr:prolyl oligopeptidase family serine peptidase [Thomasclavelia sp.]
MRKFKRFFGAFLTVAMILGITTARVTNVSADVSATGTQKAYVVGDDWGCGVTKTVITLDKTIDTSSITGSDFSVVETKEGTDTTRDVLAAYTSDASGNKVAKDSNIITIEMSIDPSTGSPIVWNQIVFRNNWATSYKLDVQLNSGETLISGTESITSLSIKQDIDVAGNDLICPQLDKFKRFSPTGTVFTGSDGTTVTYALYSPTTDNHSNSLVVWNHGAGEYGNDVRIDLLANQVTALADDEFQNTMDGAYILVPQRNYQTTTQTVTECIQAVANGNTDIDNNRVIVGGCSAGGRATMDLILAHPELYAAAYPICPATQSANVTDAQIESLKDLPIWFIHASNDPTVAYSTTTQALVTRLEAAGNTNVHTSIFADVHDTTGRFDDSNGDPYQYNGHWSWTYFDNNECNDPNGVNCWEWMANQTRVNQINATGTQKAYVVGDDWGPAVTKTVLTLDKVIDADTVDASNFKVTEEKQATTNWSTGEIGIVNNARKVTKAYTSDASGNKTTDNSRYVTIEMYVSPSDGSPFIYNLNTGKNSWCNPYKLHVSLAKGANMKASDQTISNLNVTAEIDVAGDGKICPQAQKFTNQSYKASDGTNYSYAEYTPATDSKKNALVIWLHGAGEGGSDPSIDYLGNEVTALTEKQFQSQFGGAYVITPQSPTMWMDDGTGAYQNGDKGSCYADSLYEMIQAYVSSNPDVDPNRIIIGGCSNGGYMTMEMIIKHPDYFAAAFPICEAYQDQYITNDQIKSLKKMPIWFTYAKNDPTVDPTKTAIPTIKRLKAAGNTKVHVSEFADVHDTTGRFFLDSNGSLTATDTGNPYQYSGHWSWTYFDNNQCYDTNGTNEWAWLAKQYNNRNNPDVTYSTHVQNIGWTNDASDGTVSGTVGQSKRLEAIQINCPKSGEDSDLSGKITYRVHVQNIGWQGWKENGETAGTTGRSLRLEAIEIKLTGDMAQKYNVRYRVHVQNIGWQDWKTNGSLAGTTGRSLRVEAIQIELVEK